MCKDSNVTRYENKKMYNNNNIIKDSNNIIVFVKSEPHGKVKRIHVSKISGIRMKQIRNRKHDFMEIYKQSLKIRKIISLPLLNLNNNKYMFMKDNLRINKSCDNILAQNSLKIRLIKKVNRNKYISTKYHDHYNSLFYTNCKIYRCQISTKQETCCCSCNSDAMFEVMKSLYDCYKKKNCNNCKCILCGHFPREVRRLAEKEKSEIFKSLSGMDKQEKERVLKDLAMQEKPLPIAKTNSEKELLKSVRKSVGLPPEPKSTADKKKYEEAMAAGIIRPLEGKTPAEKEKILRQQAALGLPLPEGRTSSEKAIVAKVKAVAPPLSDSIAPAKRLKRAKDAGLLTPIKGKSREEKEKILTGLAKHGIPLPEAKTPSEKKIVEKITADLGLPPSPTTPAEKENYQKAYATGLITPLEGKSNSQKEKILRNQANMGLNLPVGRTPSEKAIIDKIQKTRSKASDLLKSLKGKPPAEKEKSLKEVVMQGIPLPEAKTTSEKKIMDKIAKDVGLPPKPKKSSEKQKYEAALAKGLITPLEGKTAAQIEKILLDQAAAGLQLPEGRTPSEKDLIAKVQKSVKPIKEGKIPSEELLEPVSIPSGKMKKAKEAGYLTPLAGKTKPEKEKILKGLAMHGIPLPDGKTASEKELIENVRTSLGLPPEPKNAAAKRKYKEAIAAGIVTPLEGKTPKQKEKIIREQAALGLPLPEGRTSSEKAIIAKVKAVAPPISDIPAPSKRLKKAKEAGLLTPIKGKSREEKEKILTGLAKHGIPLPEAKTPSEKKIVEKITADLGLPPSPTTPAEKENYQRAYATGLITPLEGKSNSQKEKILRNQANMGLSLPVGRTPSEKAMIDKIKKTKGKASDLLTSLKGKPPEEKEKALKEVVMQGIPLPEAKTTSEKKIMDQIAKDVGLPPKPKNSSEKQKYEAALAKGLITPLEGKTAAQKEKILQDQAAAGLELPEGRTPSEKDLIAKVQKSVKPIKEGKVPSEELLEPVSIPSGKMKKAKEAGYLTPLAGKTKPEKEKILKGLAMHGIPLPDGKTASEKELIDNVRTSLGLPPEPKNAAAKRKYKEAIAAGIVTPLEGKTPKQKEKIIREQAALGLPLPEGRTPSEKVIIAKVKAVAPPISDTPAPSKRLKKAKEAGLLTPIKGKSKEEKEKILTGLAKHGIPLPEAKTSSEKKIVEKITADLGLPPPPTTPAEKENYQKAYAAGLITPLEGKSNSQKEKILRNQANMGLSLPVGRTPSEKAMIDKINKTRAKASDVLTSLKGKPPEEKEKALKEVVMQGIPLPEAKTTSEKKIMDQIAKDVGLPPKPKKSSEKQKYEAALAKGLITPLEGKTAAQKEKILRDQAAAGLQLPEGRTPSEKDLIAKVQKSVKPIKEGKVPSEELLEPVSIPSGKMKKAKEAGYLTPLAGKTKLEKEKILKGLAMHGIPLPDGKTASEKELIDNVRTSLGLPPEPKNAAAKRKYKEAIAAGIVTPLEGKTPKQKEKIIREQAALGLPLPEGRTSSEKAIVAKVKAVAPPVSDSIVPAKRLKRAKDAGLLTPIKGKSREEKEKILTGLAKHGIPLPEAKTPSEKKIVEKITADLGLPPPPTTPAEKENYQKAYATGLITPLEGKSNSQKEKILRNQANMGLSLPVGRTPSEKAMIDKINKTRAKASDVLTSLKGKPPEEKEKALKEVVMQGIPLPEAKTTSEKKIMDQIAKDVGLPPKPKKSSDKQKYEAALAKGLITPLEGKTAAQKEKILRDQAAAGLQLPEGRTPSEKDLIAKVQKSVKPIKEGKVPSEELLEPVSIPSGKMKKAKEAGYLTPLAGKTKLEKEKILKGLAMHGIPLPDGKTASEKELIDNVRTSLGLPPEPKNAAAKRKYKEAIAAGIVTPLEGKTPKQKEKIIREQAALGLPLPEGRTPSEKAIIAKVKAVAPPISDIPAPSKRLKKAKEAGLLTPIKGKSKEEKEKILTGLAKHGIPLPEAKTPSEKKIVEKITADLGLPPPPTTPAEKENYQKAYATGLITPLEGKSNSQKEKILRNQANMGLSLPVGRTPSEKAMIDKIKKTKGKASDLLTSLKGKPPEEKEKALKEVVMQGIPLPEAKTTSEKKIMDQIAKDVGLPPKPKKSSEKQKYEAALAKGLITPLEGKTAAQKEKILQDQAAAGLELPEGRTPSEKDLIAKVKKSVKPIKEGKVPSEELLEPVSIPSGKMKKAKEAGYLTPLAGKTKPEKEKILKGLAMHGIPLPDGKTASEKELIDNVRTSLGLPPEPKNAAAKRKYKEAIAAGIVTPLEGKTPKQKEKIIREQAALGLPLPEGRTPSEKAIIAKVKAVAPPISDTPAPSKRLKKAKEAGLLTPIKGKSKEEKEKILTGLAKHGIPLPEAKTSSEKKIVEKITADLGLPPPPTTPAEKENYQKAYAAGLITPLEGKSNSQKEKILQNQANMGLRLPQGRTPSEKAIIDKIQNKRKAKGAEILASLKGKPPEDKEKALKEIVMKGIPLPEAKTTSEKKIMDKIVKDVGLPPKPKKTSEKQKYEAALAKGLITPLEGKTAAQKEKILRDQAAIGLKLPEGRTTSEKNLISKVQASVLKHPKIQDIEKLDKKSAKKMREGKGPSDECICNLLSPPAKTAREELFEPVSVPSEKMKKAKELGYLTPLKGKSKTQKEKILKGLAMQGIPLPDGKTPSEKEVLDSVRTSLGLPQEPKSTAGKQKYKEAVVAGIITPLEGKTPKQKEKILREQAALGLPLPEGRTLSEKAMIAKVKALAPPISDQPAPSKRLKKAKEAGLLTPIKGKSREEKEKILTGLAKHGIPLPEAKTPSEKKIVEKITAALGLPPIPTTPAAKEKYQKAYAAGLITPLEGKSHSDKEKILQKQANIGLSLPVGRTPSEKALVEHIQEKTKALLTPLQGKTPEQKEKILKGLAMNGIPLPEAKSPSEQNIIEKVRADVGLPPEPKTESEKKIYKQNIASGDIAPLEGKSPAQKEKILRNVANLGLTLPEGRTSSEKSLITKVKETTSPKGIPSEKFRKAKAAGLMTPIEGKPRDEKERILKGRAMHGIPLPEAKSPSENKLMEKVRADIGLPPEPETPAEKQKYKNAIISGQIAPLEGKTAPQKEKILRKQAELGLPLPEGRTKSEKALIEKVKLSTPQVSVRRIPSEKLKKAKAAGLLTPLEGKSKEQKENILKGLAMQGIPLPEAKSPSENRIIAKVRADIGLPPEPETPAEKQKYKNAIISGEIAPLEGKTAPQKEKILRKQAKLGLPLPEGRTKSEKSLIEKVRLSTPQVSKVRIPSETLKKAKAAGLLTPLQGKSKEQKENILKGLAMQGIPLPEAITPSEKNLVEKVRADIGLPPEPETPAEKKKYKKAIISGQIAPLEGKTAPQKEKILRKQAELGLPLPEGRTKSEKALIEKVKLSTPKVSVRRIPSEKLKKAKAAGLLTPLEGKSKEQKENILKGLAMQGIPLPEAKSPSENRIIEKVRADIGLPPEPETPAEKQKYKNAIISGEIAPLEGKTAPQKEKILRKQAKLGLLLPEGRTKSEKALIEKVRLSTPQVSEVRIPSERLKKAKAAGLLTPLQGKSKEQKENILKGLAMQGIPLPEAITPSEKNLVEKVRADIGLPPEPETPAEKKKYKKAIISGQIAPLEGKTAPQKEKILRKQAELGLPLPEGRTKSEKALIEKVKLSTPKVSVRRIPSEKLKKAKAAGLLTPLEGKSKEQKENILKGLAMQGIPLPEAKSPSENRIIEKVRADIGLPPEPETPAEKQKYKNAIISGEIAPLEGKTAPQKEKILRKQAKLGLLLPEGRTKSEKALIEKVRLSTPQVSEVRIPSERLKKAKAAGLLTPLQGKSKEQKENILKGLAMQGIPLPEAITPSEKNLVEKVRADIGLPPEPETPAEKKKYKKAIISGQIAPLEGKTAPQKEKILRKQAELGLPLPEGRTKSEKALIEKVKLSTPKVSVRRIPSEKLKKAKAAGLLTPLEGKSKEQKENILKGLAMQGIPLPEAKSLSENRIIEKVRADIGLPPEPETPAEKQKYKNAIISGEIAPLEGKTAPQKEKILRKQAKLGLLLPEGRTKSEKALIEKVRLSTPQVSEVRIPSERLKKAKAAGLLTPLQGKSKEQKENILKGLAMQGIPLPEAITPSEKNLVEKVRADIGLPPEPETPAEKKKYKKAIISGQIAPLEGKTAPQKEKILRKQAELGLPLPEGRTKSEKALIEKVRLSTPKVSVRRIPSEKLKKAKAAGLLTPLEGKSKEQKEKILKGLAMQGIPLPEAITPSEKNLVEKVRADIGLPPEPETPAEKKKYKKAIISGEIAPLEGKTAPQKEKILRKQAELGLPLPEGRTKSEKALIEKVKLSTPKVSVRRIPSEKLKKAKAAGLLTPLEGKSKEQKENILKGLAMQGIPLPEAKSPSENRMIEKVLADLGLPPEPETPAEKQKYKNAIISGEIAPLEGKTAPQKEKILRKQAKLGLPLPEGRTKSEKALIEKVRLSTPQVSEVRIPPETFKKAKAAGLLTPLEGKSKEQKENILKGLAMQGIPLPEAKTPSEKKLVEKVRADIGLPPEPETPAEKKKYKKAIISGQIAPLEGKTAPQKEKILRKQAELGLPLPEGRTKSEKSLIEKVRLSAPKVFVRRIPSEKLKKAKAAGLLTPLEGKSKEQKESILTGLAMQGIPLPEAKSPSENRIIEKVRADIGLPPEPETPAAKQKYENAIISGEIAPLEGKTVPQKEKILRKQAELGLPLPEGRTKSEKALIEKVKLSTPQVSVRRIPSETLKKAKAAGLLTPLEGKSKEQKENILKGLAMQGIPLPEAKSPSENKIIEKVRADIGLPPEPETPAEKQKYKNAIISGQIAPLEGKTAPQKEKILRKQAELGLPLPEGRTKSEKALIEKVKLSTPKVSVRRIPSEKLKKAKAAGLLTPLEGKSKEQKENILKGLAMQGIPLPEAKSPSENRIIEKVRADIGLPPEPESPAEKQKYKNAIISGQIAPLEGKTAPQKEKILRKQAELGLPLPEGRTKSEKALIEKVRLSTPQVSEVRLPPEALKKAKAAGLLTPLEGKSKEQKENILKGLAMQGIPLPEAKTPSEKKLVQKVRADIGLPPEPETPAEKKKYKKAIISGQIAPLEGKTPPQKEKILRKQAELGLLLPEGRTKSEKALIEKVKLSAPQVSVRRIPSEKLKKAQAAGLLTPLEGKSKEQKENILKGLAMQGIPLPEAKSPSENRIIAKVRADLGLPPEPETPAEKQKYKNAIISGEIAPLEGKTTPQKEKVLRKQAELGLPLPEGRTKSEKALIEKVKLSAPQVSVRRIPSEKLKKAQAAGLFTPLEGKSKEQKENILKGLAMQGIPLPEAKSPSENRIIAKVRADIGLPPEPETPAEKQKYKNAIISGEIAPLEGKTAPQKEKILRKQAKLGLPLPEGRTKSEKALIEKIWLSAPLVSEVRIPPETLKKAKAAGLLTPLEGKSKDQKENILKGLAMQGIPLPEAKTPSEKKIIEKVRADIGLPPEPETPAEKKKYKKAIISGQIAPLEGKTAPQKEEILRKQAELGLPLPEGRTKSEKKLIAKVKETSEKVSRIPPKTRSKMTTTGKILKSKSKSGIVESLQEITKVTTCDKGCGCDKKKIKFKHSYVKIRITSPDISSLCPCPDECLPGVKGGVFTDSEGIKVTVGRATELTGFSSKEQAGKRKESSSMKSNAINLNFNKNNIVQCNFTRSEDALVRFMINELDPICIKSFSAKRIQDNIDKSFTYYGKVNSKTTNTIVNSFTPLKSISSSSFNSHYFENESNLSFITPNTISNLSLTMTNLSNESNHNFNDLAQDKSIKKTISEYLLRQYSYDSICALSDIYLRKNKSSVTTISSQCSETMLRKLNHDVYALKTMQSEIQEKQWNSSCDLRVESSLHPDTENNEMERLVDQIIAKELITRSSSFIILIPTSSEDVSDYSLNSIQSSICILVSNNNSFRCPVGDKPYNKLQRKMSDLKCISNNECSEEYLSTHPCAISIRKCPQAQHNFLPKMDNTKYQRCKHEDNRSRIISTDTTQDRPCCCKMPLSSALGTPFTNGGVYNNSPCDINSTRRHVEVSFPKMESLNNSCKCMSGNKNNMGKQIVSTACGPDDNFKERANIIKASDRICCCKSFGDRKPVEKSFCCGSFDEPKPVEKPLKNPGACPCQKDSSEKFKKPTKNKKNVICECPIELYEDNDVDEEDEMRDLRQMQSALTQITSGFKIDVSPKTDTDYSFEDILKYYAQQLEDEIKCECECYGKSHSSKQRNVCECPAPAISGIGGIGGLRANKGKGIKISVEGKGSASKACRGVLCFHQYRINNC